jgi:hypothetical protein
MGASRWDSELKIVSGVAPRQTDKDIPQKVRRTTSSLHHILFHYFITHYPTFGFLIYLSLHDSSPSIFLARNPPYNVSTFSDTHLFGGFLFAIGFGVLFLVGVGGVIVGVGGLVLVVVLKILNSTLDSFHNSPQPVVFPF